MSDPFLEQFEKRRLEIEGRILRMPQAAQLVGRYGGSSGLGQQYLYALPTVVTLIDFVARSPRTAGAFKDRLDRAGPTRIRHHEEARAFTCFGLAYLYRFVAKRSRDPELAMQLVRLATLATLTPAELEKVDWVARSFSSTHKDGSRDRLATANLLLWWLTGGESTSRSYEADYFLEMLSEFISKSLELALQNQIHMTFPF